MEALDPAKSGELGVRGRDLCVVRAGTIQERLTGVAPEAIKEEPGERLQERWEAQWQQGLGRIHPPPLRHGNPPRGMCWSQEEARDLRATPRSAGEGVPGSPPGVPGEDLRAHQGLETSTEVKVEAPEQDKANMETRGWNFHHFCYHEAQGPREALHRLRALCRRWLEPERRTKEQMVELVTLEQFLAILPLEMQAWVRGQGPDSCALAVTLAEGFLGRLPVAQSPGSKTPESLEDVTSGSPRVEHDSSNRIELPFPIEIKQENNGGTDSQRPDGHDWTREGKRIFPRPEKVAVAGITPRRGRPVSLQGPAVDKGVTIHRRSNTRPSDQAAETKWQTFLHETCGEGFKSRLPEGLLKQIRTKTVAGGGRCWSPSIDLHKSQKGPKLYKCTYCRKLCTYSAHLVIHERIHTGEKPHKCSECGKSFTQKGNLTSHKRIHMGERPHHCRDCGKSFSRRQQLMRHERIHSGEKPYKCPDCGKSFCRKDSLLTHKGTHAREKPSDSWD